MKKSRISTGRKEGNMEANIDYVSVNSILGIQFSDHLISFWGNQLLKNVHYTVAFNPGSNNVNLHLTKNVKTENGKPYVKLIEIDKNLLEEIIPNICKSIFNVVYEPVDILSFTKNKAALFIANKKFQRSKTAQVFQNRLIAHFKPITRVKRKSRLKIKGDIEKQADDYFEKNQCELLNVLRIKNTLSANVDTCYIPGDPATIVKKIYGHWYKLKDIEPNYIFSSILGNELWEMINLSHQRGLETIQNANSSKDTENFNQSITIVKR